MAPHRRLQDDPESEGSIIYGYLHSHARGVLRAAETRSSVVRPPRA
jgi:hypothetical protein